MNDEENGDGTWLRGDGRCGSVDGRLPVDEGERHVFASFRRTVPDDAHGAGEGHGGMLHVDGGRAFRRV